MMDQNRWLRPEEIVALAEASAAVTLPCGCGTRVMRGWESLPITFPEELLDKVGMVSPPSESEATVLEYHPDGSHYWSDEAPIALHYFPTNRCQVDRCRVCGRAFLRYTEYGGYYLDRRIRSLLPDLISLAPLPQTPPSAARG